MWNSIASGFLAGGTLAIRSGPGPALRSAMFGGVILGVIEGIQLVMMSFFTESVKPVAPVLEAAPPPPGMPM